MAHSNDLYRTEDFAGLPRDAGQTDYADMGTAFGLDATVTLEPNGPGQTPVSPADAAPPWEHRLTRRTGL